MNEKDKVIAETNEHLLRGLALMQELVRLAFVELESTNYVGLLETTHLMAELAGEIENSIQGLVLL